MPADPAAVSTSTDPDVSRPRFSTVIDATGPNGNIYAVLGACQSLMRQLGEFHAEQEDVEARVFAAKSYDAALDVIREWFPVDTGEG